MRPAQPPVVKSIGGMEIQLQTQKEADFYTEAQARYQQDFTFTAASDNRALDRLILFETQVFRWSWQLAAGMDYDLVGLEPAEESTLRRSIKETEPLIAQIQIELGLTKTQRDKVKTADSVGDYIANLKIRAKEHGVRRDAQVGRAIELIMELFSIVDSYRRSDAHEKQKLGFEKDEDILDWIQEVMRPRFDEVDLAYRKNQKMWVRTL